MPKMKSVTARFDPHPRRAVPRRIYDVEFKPRVARAKGKGAARETAETFLRAIADEIGIQADLEQLRFDQVKSSLLGSHVLFQQYEGRRPISGAWVRVDLDTEGKVYGAQNDLVPTGELKRAKEAGARAPAPIDAAEATATATEAVQAGDASLEPEVLETEPCLYSAAPGPVEAWKVVLRAKAPAREWKVYVDAASGEVLKIVDLIKYQTGRGRVFDPNPVVALNDSTLKDGSTIPEAAYREVDLPDLASNGYLDGKYVSTRNTRPRVKRTSGKYLFRRGHRGFNEVMIYFHIDRVQRYIQSLGFTNVLARDIPVNAHGTPEDQSWYSPTTRSLTFGNGGVDDAEDADIILHEYGHAIQDDQIPGFGESHECGSMGEGFGDYFAGSAFEGVKPSAMRPCVGTWDAVAYSGDEPPNLRRLDSNKKYPKDLVGEVHADGEIWSACLWELRAVLGRRMADQLVIAHHFLVTRHATFADAAHALVTADQQLNGGKNGKVIRDVFVRRGILGNPGRGGRGAGEPFARAKR